MSKKLVLVVGLAGFVVCLALPALSGPGNRGKSHRIRAGKSNTGHLYLHEKAPETWEIIEDGAWGKMKFNLSGESLKFVFNGHELEPDFAYTLIYYPDPWPGEGLICLGDGVADESGNVHIKGTAETTDLPAVWDENSEDGAKIWLVLSPDVDCGEEEGEVPQMLGWLPTEYLFEYDLIEFDDTDE